MNVPAASALALLCLCSIFSIIIPAYRGLYVSTEPATADNYGIWQYSSLNQEEAKDTCEIFASALELFSDLSDLTPIQKDAYACYTAQLHKCKTLKAFSVIGALAVAASLGLAAWAVGGATLRGGVHLAAACAAAFGSFSYLIIFSIAAYNYNQEFINAKGDEIESGGNCGLGISGSGLFDHLGYGASFILSVANSVLLLIAAATLVMASSMSDPNAQQQRGGGRGGDGGGALDSTVQAYTV